MSALRSGPGPNCSTSAAARDGTPIREATPQGVRALVASDSGVRMEDEYRFLIASA